MSVKLKIDGFDEFLSNLKKAGADIDREALKCAKECADIIDAELRSEIIATDKSMYGTQAILAERMPPPEIESEFGRYRVKVGFKKGAYNPSDPSDGYKAIFLNYGTPKRPDRYGQVQARGFLNRATRKANGKIKAVQKKLIPAVLKELNK